MGDSGQLGTGKREMKLTPKRILIKSQLEPIVAVECGSS